MPNHSSDRVICLVIIGLSLTGLFITGMVNGEESASHPDELGLGEEEWWNHSIMKIFDASREVYQDPPYHDGVYAYPLDSVSLMEENRTKDAIDNLTVAYETTDPTLDVGYNQKEKRENFSYNLRSIHQKQYDTLFEHAEPEDEEKSLVFESIGTHSSDYIKDAYMMFFDIPGAATIETDAAIDTEQYPKKILPREVWLYSYSDFRVEYEEEEVCEVEDNTKTCTKEKLLDHGMENGDLSIVSGDKIGNDGFESQIELNDGYTLASPFMPELDQDPVGRTTFTISREAYAEIEQTKDIYKRENASDDWEKDRTEEEVIKDTVFLWDYKPANLFGDVEIQQYIFDTSQIPETEIPDDVRIPSRTGGYESKITITDSVGEPVSTLRDSPLSPFLWSSLNFTEGNSDDAKQIKNTWGAYSIAENESMAYYTEDGVDLLDEELVIPEIYITPLHEKIRTEPLGGTLNYPSSPKFIAVGNNSIEHAGEPLTAPKTSLTHTEFTLSEHQQELTEATGITGDNIPINTHRAHLGLPTIEVDENGQELTIRVSDQQGNSGRDVPLDNKTLLLQGADTGAVTTDRNGEAQITAQKDTVIIEYDGFDIHSSHNNDWKALQETLDNGEVVWRNHYHTTIKEYELESPPNNSNENSPLNLGPVEEILGSILGLIVILSLFYWVAKTFR